MIRLGMYHFADVNLGMIISQHIRDWVVKSLKYKIRWAKLKCSIIAYVLIQSTPKNVATKGVL